MRSDANRILLTGTAKEGVRIAWLDSPEHADSPRSTHSPDTKPEFCCYACDYILRNSRTHNQQIDWFDDGEGEAHEEEEDEGADQDEAAKARDDTVPQQRSVDPPGHGW